MPDSILVPARKFERLLDYMERVGLDAEAMAATVHLPRTYFKELDPDYRLLGTDYSRMYRNAVQQMQTLKRPIPWAAGIGSEAFELMCHSIISCKTLGEALQMAQRFDRLAYPLINYRMDIECGPDQFSLHYHVRTTDEGSVFAPEDWDRAEHYETVARSSGLMVWSGFCGWLIGRSIDVEHVKIAASPVSEVYHQALAELFQCEIEFNADETRFLASVDYLDRRLVQTPESMEDFLENAVFQLLASNSKPSSTAAAIRSLIRLDFTGGIPSFERMAQSLHMSESSLRRRLLKEDTSYQNIKDQVRCEIAIEHLRRPDTKINDLAEILGFTEPSSFVRSFRGWMGVTPKAYRDSLKSPNKNGQA